MFLDCSTAPCESLLVMATVPLNPPYVDGAPTEIVTTSPLMLEVNQVGPVNTVALIDATSTPRCETVTVCAAGVVALRTARKLTCELLSVKPPSTDGGVTV